jgi:hypothetical protein
MNESTNDAPLMPVRHARSLASQSSRWSWFGGQPEAVRPRHNEMSAGRSALRQPTPACSLSKTGLAFGKTKGNRNGGQQNQTHRIKCGGVY